MSEPRPVLLSVGALREGDEILRAVVEFVAVDVVDMLAALNAEEQGMKCVRTTAPVSPLRVVDVAIRPDVQRQADNRMRVVIIYQNPVTGSQINR